MNPHGEQHHDFGLCGCAAGCEVLPYGRMACESAGGGPECLSVPGWPHRRKTMKWCRPTVEEVCGRRNRAAHACLPLCPESDPFCCGSGSFPPLQHYQ